MIKVGKLEPIPCYGICAGRPNWKDPETGFVCTLCQGTGKLSPATPDREKALKDWVEISKRRGREQKQ